MAELKTKVNDASVSEFLERVADPERKKASYAVLELMRKATGAEPRMWGESIIGFGDGHLKYESGRELDWFQVGFSPRKQNLALYSLGGFAGYEELLGRLGKFKTGKGCVYINRIEDVDVPVLEELIVRSVGTKA